MTNELLEKVKDAIGNAGEIELLGPLLAELWAARDADVPPDRAQLPSVERLGTLLVARGIAASKAARLVLDAGRALEENAGHAGELDRAGARRIGALVDEAVVRTVSAVEAARRRKRQQWLSYLVHELKNPLNTVLNAIWLLREKGADPKQGARFLELAERAVKRLETRCHDVRELDEALVTPPPGWSPPEPRP